MLAIIEASFNIDSIAEQLKFSKASAKLLLLSSSDNFLF